MKDNVQGKDLLTELSVKMGSMKEDIARLDGKLDSALKEFSGAFTGYVEHINEQVYSRINQMRERTFENMDALKVVQDGHNAKILDITERLAAVSGKVDNLVESHGNINKKLDEIKVDMGGLKIEMAKAGIIIVIASTVFTAIIVTVVTKNI